MVTTLTAPIALLSEADDAELRRIAEQQKGWHNDTAELSPADLTPEMLDALSVAAAKQSNTSFGRVIEAIQRAYSGKFDKPVPRLEAGTEMLIAYFRHHRIDGWLYRQQGDYVEAWLITGVKFHPVNRNQDKPHIAISLARTGVLSDPRERSGRGRGIDLHSITLWPSEVSKKTVARIITEQGWLVETPALREQYDMQTEHHREVITTGFTEQYLLTGKPRQRGYRDDTTPRANRKVVMDTEPGSLILADVEMSTVFADAETATNGDGPTRRARKGDDPEVPLPVPMAHEVDVFDLVTHDYLRVHSFDLTRYVYDASLADKLVLPASHRDLLDILTTDIGTFTGDIIEGKSAGNVILAKGVPGVGKTLTAEVYV